MRAELAIRAGMKRNGAISMALMRKLTIRSQIFVISLLMALVVMFILSASYLQMAKIIGLNNDKFTSDLIGQMKGTVYANKDVLERLMMNIAFNMDVQNFLVEEDKVQAFLLAKRIDSLLINTSTLKEGILDIVILGADGRWMDIAEGRRATESYQGAIPPDESFYYYGLQHFGDRYAHENAFLIGSRIKYSQPGELFNQSIGTLFFVVSPQALIGEIDQLSEEMNAITFFVDWQRKVVSGNDALHVESELQTLGNFRSGSVMREMEWDNKRYITHTEYLPEIKTSVVSMIPKDELMRDMNAIRLFFILIFIVGAIVMGLMFKVVTNNILTPLKKLMTFMNTVRRGDLGKLRNRIDLDGYVEMSLMANQFNDMLNKIDSLTRELLDTHAVLYGTELEKKKAELAFLRSQINPHFLYNTLEMLKGMAAVKGAKEIRDAAASLGSIFRYTIKGDGIVPLHTELSIVESYLQIQRLRFGSRFSVELSIDEDCLDILVPKMILQPLVENAVYHGLEPKEEHGTLRLSGTIDEAGDFILTIEDDGVGMDERRLRRLQELTASESGYWPREDSNNSIGFSNVDARLKLTYGQGYGLRVTSALMQGTTVTMKLPTKGDMLR
ncbi:sensor histidine kinase [Paenibacillus sp. J5C_2022]|uniref:sensor histidine kinase n=1 Tax=Paenibacillus sp. J5C2022 TaxID=2977129 RepID=UPI0021CFA475|nr:sensor histidine kinase [Paenibacillus sp. J5C2022]MCU6712638.1 sensor histidine kinase [Paenibacillus sp. J5C2022]